MLFTQALNKNYQEDNAVPETRSKRTYYEYHMNAIFVIITSLGLTNDLYCFSKYMIINLDYLACSTNINEQCYSGAKFQFGAEVEGNSAVCICAKTMGVMGWEGA